jgi:hypothetical protein
VRLDPLAIAMGLCGACSGSLTGLFSAVPAHVVERPEYGSCLEVGAKVSLPQIGTVTQLSSTCFRAQVDGGLPEGGVLEEEGPSCSKDDGGCP